MRARLLLVIIPCVASCASPAPAAVPANGVPRSSDPAPPTAVDTVRDTLPPVAPASPPPGRAATERSSSTSSAPEGRSDMTSRSQDLQASIAELEALLAGADAESRPLLERQLAALRQTMALLEAAEAAPAMPRPVLSESLRGFFTPEPPAALPVWVPDTLTRAEVTDEMMRCPPEARVYPDEDGVGCAIPQPSGPPFRHGLELAFHRSTGRLRSQRFFENRLLVWAVEYHPSGGRASLGAYAPGERLEYPEEGLHTSFAPNGTIVSQTSYRAGVRHGWSKMWDDDGAAIGATRYDAGVAVEEVLPDGTRRRP